MRNPEYSLTELGKVAETRLHDMPLTNQELLAQTLQHPDIARTTGISPLVFHEGRIERRLSCVATSLTRTTEPTAELTFRDDAVFCTYKMGRIGVRAAFLERVGDDAQLYLASGMYTPEPRNMRQPLHEVAEAVLMGQDFTRRYSMQDPGRGMYLPPPLFPDKERPELSAHIADDAKITVEQHRSADGETSTGASVTCAGIMSVPNPYPSIYSIADHTIYRPITEEYKGIPLDFPEESPFRASTQKSITEPYAVNGGMIYRVNPEVDPDELGHLTHNVRLTMTEEAFIYHLARGGDRMWTSGAEHFIEHFRERIGTYMSEQHERALTPQKLLAEADRYVARPNNIVEVVQGIPKVVQRLCKDFAPSETEQNA